MLLRGAHQSLFPQRYYAVSSSALLIKSKVRKPGGIMPRPMVGRFNSESAALIQGLVSQTIDVTGFSEVLLDSGLNLWFHAFGSQVYLGLLFRLRFA